MRRLSDLGALVIGCCAAAAACGGARPGPTAAREALDAMTEAQRAQLLEATTTALDARPRYVDELYAIARRHPRTFGRVLGNTVRDLRVARNAQRTAELLVRDPEAFEQMLVAVLDAVQDEPAARARLAEAIVRRRAIVADILTDRPDALVPVLNVTLRQVRRKPDARAGMRAALEQSSKSVAPVLIEDPDTLGALLQALLDAGMDVGDALDALTPRGEGKR